MFFLTKRPGARAKAVIAAACVAALLAGCKSEVYKGLTETQANAMMSVLLKNGIDSEKEYSKTGYSLRVDSDKVVQTLELMRRNNLPREDFQNMGQIFAAKGMISSSTEEQARMTYALSQELSDTFSSIDGVLTARVHVVLGSQDLATGRVTPPSAAVFMRHTPESQVTRMVPRIQELTGNAVPGLSPEHVSVMLVPVRETVSVPMAESITDAGPVLMANKWLLGTLVTLALLALGGLSAAGFLFWKMRQAKPESEPQQQG